MNTNEIIDTLLLATFDNNWKNALNVPIFSTISTISVHFEENVKNERSHDEHTRRIQLKFEFVAFHMILNNKMTSLCLCNIFIGS